MDHQITLPNQFDFVVKSKKQYMNTPQNNSLTWTVKRRKFKTEPSKHDLINEIACYIGKLVNNNKKKNTRSTKRKHTKSTEGKQIIDVVKENTILYYFKYI